MNLLVVCSLLMVSSTNLASMAPYVLIKLPAKLYELTHVEFSTSRGSAMAKLLGH